MNELCVTVFVCVEACCVLNNTHMHALNCEHTQLDKKTNVGESYAGIYVPMLAREVVEGNKRGVKPHINIKVTLFFCFLVFDVCLFFLFRLLCFVSVISVCVLCLLVIRTTTQHILNRVTWSVTDAQTLNLMRMLRFPLLWASP